MTDDNALFRSALHALATEMGLPDLEFDSVDEFIFEVDGEPMTIWLQDEPMPHVLLSVPIASIEPADHEATAFLLQGNFQTWSSGAMTIGLDDTYHAVGFTSLPVEHAEKLGDMVVALAIAAREVRTALLSPDRPSVLQFDNETGSGQRVA